jgi:hypothetical protein
VSDIQSYSASPAPAAVSDAEAALHGLLGVVHNLVNKSMHVYHEEGEKLADIAAISKYEKHALGVLKQEAARLEHDYAGNEDVTQRLAPSLNYAQAPAQPIDYDKLAAAIAKLNAPAQSQSQAVSPTSIITGAEQSAAPGGAAL